MAVEKDEYVISVKNLASQELIKITRQAKSAEDALNGISIGGGRAGKSMEGLGVIGGKIGGILAGAFALDRITAFASKVIEIRGEFQKYEAVLGIALQSQTLAGVAMGELQNLAATTNFSVSELTNSYVKLVNRGMKPTSDELMNLADLANSTGKSYDQLVEAILDAQTGEFERLKEFGITAHKHGQQVRFTFKGVSQEVKFAAQDIGDYITKLGDLRGVAGSTEVISKTLTGQVSNFGDAIDQLFNVIGSKSESVVGNFIVKMTNAVTSLSNALDGYENVIKRDPAVVRRAKEDERAFQEAYDASLKYSKTKGLGKERTQQELFRISSELNIQNVAGEDAARKRLLEFDKKKGIVGSEDEAMRTGLYLSDAEKQQRTNLLASLQMAENRTKIVNDLYKNTLNKINTPGSSAKSSMTAQADALRQRVKPTTIIVNIAEQIGIKNLYSNDGKQAAQSALGVLKEGMLAILNDSNLAIQ